MMTIRIIILAALTGVVEGQNLNEEGQELQETKRSLANKAGLSEFGSLVDDVRSLQCGFDLPKSSEECTSSDDCAKRERCCKSKGLCMNVKQYRRRCQSRNAGKFTLPKQGAVVGRGEAIPGPSLGTSQGPTLRQPSSATNLGPTPRQPSFRATPAPPPPVFGLGGWPAPLSGPSIYRPRLARPSQRSSSGRKRGPFSQGFGVPQFLKNTVWR